MIRNKPYKVTFILYRAEIIALGGKVRVRGLDLKGEVVMTAPIIKYDEAEGWAETQIYQYKLMSWKEDSDGGSRLEEGEERKLEGGSSEAHSTVPLSPPLVRKT